MQRVFGFLRANLKIIGAAFLCVVLSATTSFMVAKASIPASNTAIMLDDNAYFRSGSADIFLAVF